MQVLFLRHGPAQAKNDWTGDDEQRPLTPEGKLLVEDIACSLPRLKARPEIVLTSPLARAHETGQLVGRCLGAPDKVLVDKRLAPGFGLKQLERILRDYSDIQCLMLVGHDPDLSEVVRAVTGGRLSIRKGGLAQVDIPDAKVMKGRLISLLVPAPVNPDGQPADPDL